MKLTSRLVTYRKIVAGALTLLSVATVANAASDRSSMLHEAWSEDVFSIRQSLFSSPEARLGALTLDNVYTFDFATAGIGTVTFRPRSNRLVSTTVIHDMPRSVPSWNSPAASSDSGFYFESPGFTRGSGGIPLDDQSVDGPGPIVAAPEPGTWIGAALALVAIGFTQRRRFRTLIAHRA